MLPKPGQVCRLNREARPVSPAKGEVKKFQTPYEDKIFKIVKVLSPHQIAVQKYGDDKAPKVTVRRDHVKVVPNPVTPDGTDRAAAAWEERLGLSYLGQC